MNKKDRRKKKDRIRMAKWKVRRCSTQFAVCRDDKVMALSEFHFDWWAGKGGGPCTCIKCANLYEPGTILGVIIFGGVKPGKRPRSGRVFVDLCNMQYWNLIDAPRRIDDVNDEHQHHYKLDRHTVANLDMQTVSRVVAKVESRLSLLI